MHTHISTRCIWEKNHTLLLSSNYHGRVVNVMWVVNVCFVRPVMRKYTFLYETSFDVVENLAKKDFRPIFRLFSVAYTYNIK